MYIAPLKALVRERIDDWNKGLCKTLGKTMVELTGDYTPDIQYVCGCVCDGVHVMVILHT